MNIEYLFRFLQLSLQKNKQQQIPYLNDFLINISFSFQIGEASTDSGYDTIKLQHQISGGSSVSSSVVSTNLIYFLSLAFLAHFWIVKSSVELKSII